MPALTPGRRRKPAPKRPRRRAAPSKWLRAALRIGLPSLAVIAVAGGTAWALMSGSAARLAAGTTGAALRLSADMGLKVRHILVSGRKRARLAEVDGAIGVGRGSAILGFDPHRAKARLERLPWIRAANVERRLPDTIYVRLAEREPMALWQVGGAMSLIDREGVVITREHLGRYRNLPLLVGNGANRHGETIIGILRAQPEISALTTAMVRVADRRWDLQLRGGIRVQLPETGAARALARLAELVVRDRIGERDVIAIDLRLPDRLVVRMAPGAGGAPESGGKNKRRGAPGDGAAAKRPSKDT